MLKELQASSEFLLHTDLKQEVSGAKAARVSSVTAETPLQRCNVAMDSSLKCFQQCQHQGTQAVVYKAHETKKLSHTNTGKESKSQ